MIEFGEALALILKNTPPPRETRIPLQSASGRTLSRDVYAGEDTPSFPSSAMDGYAVRSSDVKNVTPTAPARLRLIGSVTTGDNPTLQVGPGEAVAIVTGAVVPEGADAVCIVEETELEGESVKVRTPVNVFDNIRQPGEELRNGDLALSRGTLLTPPGVGLMARLGVSEVPVYELPRVSIVTTGGEIVEPDQTPPRGKIRDSNKPSLSAALGWDGIEPGLLASAPDDAQALTSTLKTALSDSDVLLTTGGVSVGTDDLVKQVLKQLGVASIFWRIAMKPGKPTFLGKLGNKMVFGLPGNPAAAMISYYEIVRPALMRMKGHAHPLLPPADAILATEVRKDSKRMLFLRGSLKYLAQTPTVEINEKQESHILVSFARSNCILPVPAGSETIPEGTKVQVQLLPWVRAS